MGETWFVADTHFNHANIIRYCNRPFLNVDEMNKAIWNGLDVVGSEDTLVHIGDVAWTKTNKEAREIVERLPGKRKILVKGNHDRDNICQGFDEVHSILNIDLAETKIVCCHYPIASWDGAHWGSIHLFGHTHNTYIGRGKSLDVGVENLGYRPISLTEVLKRMENVPPLPSPHDWQLWWEEAIKDKDKLYNCLMELDDIAYATKFSLRNGNWSGVVKQLPQTGMAYTIIVVNGKPWVEEFPSTERAMESYKSGDFIDKIEKCLGEWCG